MTLSLKLYGPFLWIGFTCLKAAEPIRGDSLLLTTKFSIVRGTHLISFVSMKGSVDLGGNPIVLNPGPLDWESSAQTSRPLLNNYESIN